VLVLRSSIVWVCLLSCVVMLGCSFVSYLGGFDGKYNIHKIPKLTYDWLVEYVHWVGP
jgi:hypothetical protein